MAAGFREMTRVHLSTTQPDGTTREESVRGWAVLAKMHEALRRGQAITVARAPAACRCVPCAELLAAYEPLSA